MWLALANKEYGTRKHKLLFFRQPENCTILKPDGAEILVYSPADGL